MDVVIQQLSFFSLSLSGWRGWHGSADIYDNVMMDGWVRVRWVRGGWVGICLTFIIIKT